MNFISLSHSYLYQQQQALKKFEYDFKNYKQWLQQREEIEKNIIQIQQEMDQEFYQKYRKGTLDEQLNDFHLALEKKRDQIFYLKQLQQQIDKQLDQIDDLSKENLYQFRLHILHTIWLLYPERQAIQSSKWQEWSSLCALEIDISSIEKMLEHLEKYLSIAMQTRQSIKGKGIFSYIFGVSPNSIIEKQLIEMRLLIERTSPLFEKALQCHFNQSLTLLMKNLVSWLEKLKITCSKPWSFRHLDTLFAETIPVLNQFTNELTQQQQELVSRIRILNQEIQDWIQDEST